MSASANKEQLNRWTQGKPSLLEAGRLTDEDKLKDSLSLSKLMCPPLEEDGQGKLTAFCAKMSSLLILYS